MKALLYLDLMAVKKTAVLGGVLGIGICLYSFMNGAVYLVAPVCIYLAMILSSITYLNDCRYKYQKYLFSMPVKKSTYILGKLLFAVVLGLIGGLLTAGDLFLNGGQPFGTAMLGFAAVLVLTVLLAQIQLTFLVRFGEERGRLVMGLTYLIFMLAVMLVKDRLSGILSFFQKLDGGSLQLLLWLSVALGCLLTIGCIRLSIRLLNKKEY